jgi:hypothetical protein
MTVIAEDETKSLTEFHCALCDVLLTPENNSREHLLPNGIGGQKTVKNVFCKACNSRTGSAWDADLTKQLNLFNLLFAIKRDRGNVQAQDFTTVSGQQVRVHPEGHLSFPPQEPVRTQTEKGFCVQARVGTRREAKTFLSGMKRHNPELDIEEQMRNLKVERTYLNDPIFTQLSVGGLTAGRSFVKSAYALAVASGVPPKICIEARAYLLAEDGVRCFEYFYKRDLVTNRSQERVFHCVAVQGDPTTGQLIGYVELYSAWRMVICLSSQYTGDAFESSYAVDPSTGEEVGLSFDLKFSREELCTAINSQTDYKDELQKALNAMMAVGYPASLARERERALHRAFTAAMERLGVSPGGRLLPEQVPEFSHIMAEEMMPCILHQMSIAHGRIG